ncbi:MAG: exodeoxyribonuclease VII large subunit, partial [Muribaculaceae bacterium]|nr:exodeoxyribonuclease VII large subunit [Muribaculaceae bacterium]
GKSRIEGEHNRLGHMSQVVNNAVARAMERERMRLEALTDKVQLLSPQNTLNRGYSLTTLNGHVVTSAQRLKPGDALVTRLKDGSVKSVVN